MSVTIDPAYDEWPALLVSNKERVREIAGRLGPSVMTQARVDLLAAAKAHEDRLAETARRVGIEFRGAPAASGDLQSIVMAGHQPVVYHPGLLFKNEMLSRFAAETRSTGVNVIIDTDEGDAGKLSWPGMRDGGLATITGTITAGDGIYRDQRVAAADAVERVFSEMATDLENLGLSEEANKARSVGGTYERLSGEPLVVANALVRGLTERRGYVEAPFSALLAAPAIKQIVWQWIHDFERLAPLYNSVLERYRTERKIKNAANPFPNMTIAGDRFEVPFWEIDSSGARHALELSRAKSYGANAQPLIAPRGSIVTLLLRTYCSDFFVHGLGGAKYDPFVDAFASAYLGVLLPRFTVASRTAYLFPDKVERYRQASDAKAKYKEIVSHTDKFFGTGLFSADEELKLRDLITPREGTLIELQSAQTPDERSAAAHRLNAINRSIKEFIDTSSYRDIVERTNVPAPVVATWENRQFPFFLFAGESL